MAERKTQKQQHDRKINCRSDPESFRPGQRVALQDPVSKEWSVRGQIIEEVAPRSFAVRVPGGHKPLRRNRQQLRKLHSTTSTNGDTLNQNQQQPQQHHQHHQHQQHQQLEDELYDFPNEVDEFPGECDDDNYSDSDTIPYDDRDTFHTENKDNTVTRSGRQVQIRKPLDYDEI